MHTVSRRFFTSWMLTLTFVAQKSFYGDPTSPLTMMEAGDSLWFMYNTCFISKQPHWEFRTLKHLVFTRGGDESIQISNAILLLI